MKHLKDTTRELTFPLPIGVPGAYSLGPAMATHGYAIDTAFWGVRSTSPFIEFPGVDYTDLLRSIYDAIVKLLSDIRAAVAQINRQRNVTINSFSPEPYRASKPLPVSLQGREDEWIATFFDANISSAGATEEEAFSNLRSLLLDIYEGLEEKSSTNSLGPEPARQLAVLKEFIAAL